MGTKFNNFTQFNNVAVSSTNNYLSAITDLNQQHNVGLDITFTGTMAGTLLVTCCNDGVNFKPLTFNPVITQPSGSNLGLLIDLNQVPFQYLQLSYTNANGSGTINSILTSKDLGS